jgi:glycosyltransferase involved in cell wall biosynthesis
MCSAQVTVRLLTYTNLYPNTVQPTLGVFVERRLLRLVAEPGIDAVVIAPVPWIPPPINYLRRYRSFRGISREEQRDGIHVFHPRFLSIPGLNRYLAPFTMMFATLRLVHRLVRRDGFRVIDAHYFYPDGVAAALIARVLKMPLVVTARGTDVNLLPEFPFPRLLIRWAARKADRIITVSEALRSKLVALGVCASKITTLKNGVDTDQFVLRDRCGARRNLGLPDGLILLSVGNLVETKGHHLVIEALVDLPDAYLVVVGAGEQREHLERLTRRLGVAQRVRFTGTLTAAELVSHYNAADMLVLASEREGMPNVILEALSCGLPVVAINRGGIGEIVNRPELGVLLDERSAAAIGGGIRHLLAYYPDRHTTRMAAGALGWGTTIATQAALYRELAKQP